MAILKFAAPTEETQTQDTPVMPPASYELSEIDGRAVVIVTIPLAEDTEIVQNTRKAKGGEPYLQSITLGGTHNSKSGRKFKIGYEELLATMPPDFQDARLAGQYLEVSAEVRVRAADAPAEESNSVAA